MPKEQLTIWYECLKDLDYKLVEKGVQKLILTNKFYPTIADIRESCREIVQGQKKSGLEAWGIFRKYINIYSTHEDYVKLQQDYPDIYELVKAVGGRELLTGNADFIRPEFERMYNEHRENLVNQALLPEAFRNEVASLRSTVYAQLEAGEGA